MLFTPFKNLRSDKIKTNGVFKSLQPKICVHLYDGTNISIMREFQLTKYRRIKLDKIKYKKINNKIPEATHGSKIMDY